MFILKRYFKFYKNNGLLKSLVKIISTPFRLVNKMNYQKTKKDIFNENSTKKRFDLIYEKNFWSSKESVSGLGSQFDNTISIKDGIRDIIKKYDIKEILDAPCGDFNWIKDVLSKDLTYTGVDIVEKLIQKNKNLNSHKNIDFLTLDITKDKLPDSDLMICRDCLIHLSFESINSFFKNFLKSDIKYILMTIYKLKNKKKKIINLDIPDGEYREIDLSEPPFSLNEPYQKILDKDEQNKQSGFYCYLNLYSKKQINNLILNKIK